MSRNGKEDTFREVLEERPHLKETENTAVFTGEAQTYIQMNGKYYHLILLSS